jgi:hypothetical protein
MAALQARTPNSIPPTSRLVFPNPRPKRSSPTNASPCTFSACVGRAGIRSARSQTTAWEIWGKYARATEWRSTETADPEGGWTANSRKPFPAEGTGGRPPSSPACATDSQRPMSQAAAHLQVRAHHDARIGTVA